MSATLEILGVSQEKILQIRPDDADGIIIVLGGRTRGFVHNQDLKPEHRNLQGEDLTIRGDGVLVVRKGEIESFVQIPLIT